jgi:hypothetical protein
MSGSAIDTVIGFVEGRVQAGTSGAPFSRRLRLRRQPSVTNADRS